MDGDIIYLLYSRVQNSGLGGLRHNTVVLGWPYGWRHNLDERSYKIFLGRFYHVIYCPLTLYLLVSSADKFCKQFGPRSGLTERQA